MFHPKLKTLLLTMALGAATHTTLAAISQSPLLNRPNTVAPNMALVLDTSGSMDEAYIYQYGDVRLADGYGMPGPTTLTYAKYSPDVNEIYYDPRTLYVPRVNYLGNYMATSTSTSNWQMYFRKTTGPYTASQLGNASDYYSPYAPPASEVVAGSTATYPVNTSTATSTTKFPKFNARTDCVNATWCTRLEERQNRKNWSDWYSTRGKMAVTGIMAAFATLKPGAIRLGYGTIDGLDGGNFDQGVSLFGDPTVVAPAVEPSTGVKGKFFTWLAAQTFTSSTPNLTAINNAGKYFERKDSDGPWATLPNPNSTGISTVSSPTGPGKNEVRTDHASCRRSFTMLITDGYSNGTVPTTAGNADNIGFSISPAIGLPFTYVPTAPYKGSANSNTMADIAMYYWGRDLRTGTDGLANRVPPINTATVQNPSSWQNVSFYAVTLGIDGTLPQTAATRTNLNSGATSWPAPVNNTPSTVDDLWHATINGRGELLNASNGPALTSGLKRMFESIAGLPETLSGVAVSATFLKDGTRKYKPEYIPGAWTGKLSAIELDATTGNDKIPTNVLWQVEQGVDAVTQDPISLIQPAATRQSHVFTWNGSSAVPFNAGNASLSADLVNYILGDSSKELRKAGGTYRSRTAKLGDIVNSSPAYVFGNVDLNYEKLGSGFGDYRAFVTAKLARPEGVLFVGANDGMLHAFGNRAGTEYFAFVPKAVIPNLYKLAESPYTHQYFVDGPNTETDAYLDGTWKNLVLGTTGAGAKALYALDVTIPTSMDASKVLWEISSSSTGFSNLGHLLYDVQSGKVAATGSANDDWVAVFGNGVGSTSGYASLFVVNLKTGGLLREIMVDTSGSNGLGGVRLVRDATQRIVGAYAGDLKGNLWKFDLTGSTKSVWKVGLAGSPLYAAGSTQPVTATPAIVPHPGGGYVVSFGTGKFYELSDTDAPFVTQHIYGVWDKQPFDGASTAPPGASLTNTSQLQVQTIGSVVASGTTYYTVSSNPVSWGDGLSGVGSGGGSHRGWYIDLPNSGQRVAYPIERLFEKSGSTFLLVSTISPVSAAATDLCVQTGSGSGWTYLIDGVTGSGTTKPTLDTNGDGTVDATDTVVSGYQDPIDGRPTAISISSTPTGETGCIVTAQNKCVKFELKCGQAGMPPCAPPTPTGPVTVKQREWRQLFMR
jgi:type IV pilus assembly protein PilY1